MKKNKDCFDKIWTDTDRELLQNWVLTHKQENVEYKKGHPELSAMFPMRTNNALYARWRLTRIYLGLSPTTKSNNVGLGEKMIHKTVGFDLNGIINNLIEAEIARRVEIRIQGLHGENKKLTELLGKSHQFIEALQNFK